MADIIVTLNDEQRQLITGIVTKAAMDAGLDFMKAAQDFATSAAENDGKANWDTLGQAGDKMLTAAAGMHSVIGSLNEQAGIIPQRQAIELAAQEIANLPENVAAGNCAYMAASLITLIYGLDATTDAVRALSRWILAGQ